MLPLLNAYVKSELIYSENIHDNSEINTGKNRSLEKFDHGFAWNHVGGFAQVLEN